jgi:hypothetical protein
MDEITKKLNTLRDLVDTYDLVCTSKNINENDVIAAEYGILNIMKEIRIELGMIHDGIAESN